MADTGVMFESFTDRARRVLVLSQEEGRLLNHDFIGTEHVLLGLIRESDGVAAQALGSLGISLEAVRSQVEEMDGRGGSPPPGHIPFSPRAKRVLQHSQREALQLGHREIGTEDLLLGLIREHESVGAKVLVKLGAELSSVRQQVIMRLSLSGQRGPKRHTPEQMRVVTLDALLACWRNEPEVLRDKIGEAVRMAHELGDSEQLDLLAEIVDIDDPHTGQVRLRPRPRA
jgi:ATP-dependent Clp protease ATP-binding subunit ClpA